MNILLVEDSESIVKGLKYSFEKSKYNLQCAMTVREAEEAVRGNIMLDLIILDINLPDGDGFTFYEDYVKNSEIPTIFLTAKDDENYIVKGLDMGAEDYITKPFSTRELMARVNRVLLRSKKHELITVKDIKFNPDKMEVYKGDKRIEFTSLEIKLLSLLFLNLNNNVRRSFILDKIWEWTGNYVDDHTVTVYYKRIREKLKSDIIITVKGIGYRIDEETTQE